MTKICICKLEDGMSTFTLNATSDICNFCSNPISLSPSVRDTPVLCQNTYEIIFEILSPLDSPITFGFFQN